MVELNQMRMIEKSMWRQKSRVTWLKERDCITAFFLKWHPPRRRSNLITAAMVGLDDNGSVSELKARVTKAFRGRVIANKEIHVES